jgi:hypothetical protein
MNWSGKGLFALLLILLCLSFLAVGSTAWAGDSSGLPAAASDERQLQPRSASEPPASASPGRPGGGRAEGGSPQPAPGRQASSGNAGSGAQWEQPVLIGALILLAGMAVSGFILFKKK